MGKVKDHVQSIDLPRGSKGTLRFHVNADYHHTVSVRCKCGSKNEKFELSGSGSDRDPIKTFDFPITRESAPITFLLQFTFQRKEGGKRKKAWIDERKYNYTDKKIEVYAQDSEVPDVLDRYDAHVAIMYEPQ